MNSRDIPNNPADHDVPDQAANELVRQARDLGTYSQRWFSLFLDGIPEENTVAEVDFLTALLPLDRYPRILDVCCGPARHGRRLSERGYRVTGVDRDAAAIERARRIDSLGQYHCADVRSLPEFDESFDGVICMWASFGGFSDEENEQFLARLAGLLRSGGRLVLDVYNGDFFRDAEPVRERNVDGAGVIERKRLKDGRLYVTLEYEDGASDSFQWRIYTVQELVVLMSRSGCGLVGAYAGFRATGPATSSIPRMQLVFEMDERAGRSR